MGFAGLGQVVQVQRLELTELAYNDQSAGEPLAVYDVVFRDGGFWKKANSRTSPRNALPIGMAQATAVSGATLDVWIQALVSNGAWALTSGARVFLASGNGLSGGVLAATPPSASGDTVLTLGWAVGVNAIEFRADQPITLGQ